MAHIRLDSITKKFGGRTALRDLTLDIADGEFFVLLGPTGAGKTTTLRLIAGLDKPTAGSVFIDGADVGDWSAAERDVALVLPALLALSALHGAREPRVPAEAEGPQLFARPRSMSASPRAAKTLRIDHLLDRKTDRLSGGEMQRVSIGRAIVREPRVFLMDEPLSNLDAKLREALRTELKDLQMKLGATFLFVTHDQIEAMSMGDKIGVLNKGRLVQVGTPHEIYNNPRNTFVAGFVGSPAMNLLDGELQRRSGDRAVRQARRDACRRAGARCRRLQRPGHLRHPRGGRHRRSRRAGRGQGPSRRESRGRADPDVARRRPPLQGDRPGDPASRRRGHGPLRLGAGQDPRLRRQDRRRFRPSRESGGIAPGYQPSCLSCVLRGSGFALAPQHGP